MPLDRSKIEEALFEARPYVEYWDRLKNFLEKLSNRAKDEENLLELLEEEIQRAEEPFRTDLKIFLQKFKAL